MVKGSLLQVRIDDPLRLMATDKGSSAGDIIVGILLPQALFQPMRLASGDASGRTYDVAIPTNMPVRVQIHSTHLQIADSQGLSLVNAATWARASAFAEDAADKSEDAAASLASASTLTAQIPPGTATQVMTFHVTGKK